MKPSIVQYLSQRLIIVVWLFFHKNKKAKNKIYGNYDGFFVDSVIKEWSIYFYNVKLIDDHST